MADRLRPPAPDQAARDRITGDLDDTLFVEAGAGSGKTTALVERVVALVTTGAAELRQIAAITFTDKAAAELRDRIRQALERAAADVTVNGPEVTARCADALDQLDSAAIGTLHSFAQRLLNEHPVEAGLPPRVEVLDEVTSGIAFEQRWVSFRDRLLDDPEIERALVLLLACGVRHDALRALALEFDRNWDLVDERVPPDAPEPPPVRRLLDEAVAALDAVVARRGECALSVDKLRAHLDELEALADQLRDGDDEIDLLAQLDPDTGPKLPSFKTGNKGKAAAWRDIESVRADIARAGAALTEVRATVANACAERIASALRQFTLAAAAERRAAGRLDFHDLLVLARSLLRDPVHGAAVRRRLHDRYRRLLLDEFQDTDPIQIELAVRIAADDPSAAAAADAPWHEVPVTPGQLFVVGDPKQSIYRFRRADIATFLKAKDHFGGDDTVELTANFRTVAPIIDWVNTVFDRLLAEAPFVDEAVASQAPYVALAPVRPPVPQGPPVAVFGIDEHPSTARADDLRAAEAADVVGAIQCAIGERWAVGDGVDADGSPLWREPRLGDITILVPARTSLPFLEDALGEAGIPFRAETSSLVYATRAVRDLLMVLRAADDPTDSLRVISALRTPLLACGDDDLFRYRRAGGRWDYTSPDLDEWAGGHEAVLAGLRFLRDLHDDRRWRSPSELLDRVVREQRALELGFAEGRPRDVWRRIRFVIDQARAWAGATGGTLRQYLQWVDRQAAEGTRVAEAVLPETDDDAVRIMTIHAAKGLEFPITIVSGLSTVPQGRPAAAEVRFPPAGPPGYKLGKAVTTDVFEAFKPIDEQMAADERVRLLYVACTRAKDHLVVSLHRRARRGTGAVTLKNRTNAEALVAAMGADLREALPVASAATAPGPAATPLLRDPPLPPPLFDEWQDERESAVRQAARSTAVAATALTEEGTFDAAGDLDEVGAGLLKGPRDLDLPPWLKGRYGTAVGRAVHGTLQTIDLATGHGLDDAVAAQCQAEAIPDRVDAVRRLVSFALGSPAVREAARSPHWRELYACAPMDDGRLLEGYVDLLYRTVDGLVVVDYKTSASADPDDLTKRVEGYRLQGEAYARTVAMTTGEPVARVVFVFLTPSGATERQLTLR